MTSPLELPITWVCEDQLIELDQAKMRFLEPQQIRAAPGGEVLALVGKLPLWERHEPYSGGSHHFRETMYNRSPQ